MHTEFPSLVKRCEGLAAAPRTSGRSVCVGKNLAIGEISAKNFNGGVLGQIDSGTSIDFE